ncbi:DUF4282 domain-containing protein [Halothiobacillus sp. DCM-1]|uniref:DUF4282 domain-containing protein n=1 Tax=Halothiobacillus sp. DCM-1 TaxID=3112558 RepID=UPI0032484E54
MNSLLFFNEMITPKIITVIYWLLLVSVVIGGLFQMFNGAVLSGLGTMIFGAIGVRIWSELLIVLFKINENIQRLADK